MPVALAARRGVNAPLAPVDSGAVRGLEGTGRLHVADDVLTLAPLDLLLVEPTTIRQLFNDTATDQLWLVVGAPANTLEMSAAELAVIYPDVRKALPAELQGMDG